MLMTLQEKPALGRGHQPIPPSNTQPRDGDLPQAPWPRFPYTTVRVWVWFSFSFREPALLEELFTNILTGNAGGSRSLAIYWNENLRAVQTLSKKY